MGLLKSLREKFSKQQVTSEEPKPLCNDCITISMVCDDCGTKREFKLYGYGFSNNVEGHLVLKFKGIDLTMISTSIRFVSNCPKCGSVMYADDTNQFKCTSV